jgi:hypothetical protein
MLDVCVSNSRTVSANQPNFHGVDRTNSGGVELDSWFYCLFKIEEIDVLKVDAHTYWQQPLTSVLVTFARSEPR